MRAQEIVSSCSDVCLLAQSHRCGIEFEGYDVCLRGVCSNLVPCTITYSSESEDCFDIGSREPVPTSIVRDGIRRARSSGSADTVLIDIRTCDLTLSQVMEGVRMLSMGLPGHEVFMDGDLYSIVARRRSSGRMNVRFDKGATV